MKKIAHITPISIKLILVIGIILHVISSNINVTKYNDDQFTTNK